MNEYHKIQTVFKRDPETKFKTLLEGQWSLPEFEYLADNEWVLTEKVDGTNIRVMVTPVEMPAGKIHTLSFGGKTDNAQIPAELGNRLIERFNSAGSRSMLAEMFPEGACLYGEGYGAKIQKGGGNYRSDQDFVLFDVKVGHYWLQRQDVEDVANKLGLDVVPVITTCGLLAAIEMTRIGFKSAWGDFHAEGIVARPKVELKARNGLRIITKIKTRDFIV